MKELKKLKEAIEAKRFDGRIEEIRKAFKAYKESFGLSRWQRFKRWFTFTNSEPAEENQMNRYK